MSIEQQIQACEDRINRLEQMKQKFISELANHQSDNNQSGEESYLNRINIDLDENYQHYAVLKIRRMMGF
ncbi:MAG: hypothetical protein AMS27_06385 [Bacteroides sp. SM23_62_1]|nr:MAG: hypothetical protein AMS27_06385 [Bacteroides sp. SM23_62_1]